MCDSSFVKLHIQETESIRNAAENVPTSQPTIVVQKNMEAFLIIEKLPICKVPLGDLPLTLLAAFYTFNLHYPEGCSNLYSFFEKILLKIKHSGKKHD